MWQAVVCRTAALRKGCASPVKNLVSSYSNRTGLAGPINDRSNSLSPLSLLGLYGPEQRLQDGAVKVVSAAWLQGHVIKVSMCTKWKYYFEDNCIACVRSNLVKNNKVFLMDIWQTVGPMRRCQCCPSQLINVMLLYTLGFWPVGRKKTAFQQVDCCAQNKIQSLITNTFLQEKKNYHNLNYHTVLWCSVSEHQYSTIALHN